MSHVTHVNESRHECFVESPSRDIYQGCIAGRVTVRVAVYVIVYV